MKTSSSRPGEKAKTGAGCELHSYCTTLPHISTPSNTITCSRCCSCYRGGQRKVKRRRSACTRCTGCGWERQRCCCCRMIELSHDTTCHSLSRQEQSRRYRRSRCSREGQLLINLLREGQLLIDLLIRTDTSGSTRNSRRVCFSENCSGEPTLCFCFLSLSQKWKRAWRIFCEIYNLVVRLVLRERPFVLPRTCPCQGSKQAFLNNARCPRREHARAVQLPRRRHSLPSLQIFEGKCSD